MIEAMLFTSGRPIVIVPPDWTRGARFENIIVAWDGSGRGSGNTFAGARRTGRNRLCFSRRFEKHPEHGSRGPSLTALQESGGCRSPDAAWRHSRNPPRPCVDGESRSYGDGGLRPSADVGNRPWRGDQRHACRRGTSALPVPLSERPLTSCKNFRSHFWSAFIIKNPRAYVEKHSRAQPASQHCHDRSQAMLKARREAEIWRKRLEIPIRRLSYSAPSVARARPARVR
jgi:hypothetical protein